MSANTIAFVSARKKCEVYLFSDSLLIDTDLCSLFFGIYARKHHLEKKMDVHFSQTRQYWLAIQFKPNPLTCSASGFEDNSPFITKR